MTVNQRRLDDFLADNPFDANVMVLDIQGAELMALKGATQTLQRVYAIVSEISYDELYDGSVLAEDLDAFLLTHGFVRVSSILKPGVREGDALYVKKRFLKIPDLQSKVLKK